METKREESIRPTRRYVKPRLEKVIIDNNISLVMASDPPPNPPEDSVNPDHFNFNPFKMLKF